MPGDRALSERLITLVMERSDVAYAQEWLFDHGIMVPLHFLTPRYDLPIIPVNINCQGPPLAPLHRAWTFGESLRAAADAVHERIAVIGTGGISHWPATPDSGKINEAWDREFLARWAATTGTRAVGLQRPRRLRRGRSGRLRDPHVRRRQRRGRRGDRHGALLRTDPDLRRRLHGRHVRPRISLIVDNPVDSGQTDRHERWGALHDHARRLVEGCLLPARRSPR